MPAGGITISGGSGSDTIAYSFTVTGTNTLRYAEVLQNAINNLIGTGAGQGGESITPIVQGNAGALPPGADAATPVYNLVPSTADSTGSFYVGGTGYIVDSIGGTATVNAHGASDSIIVAAVNPATTYNDFGGNNLVVFVDGNNTFNGEASDKGGDTVVAGSGFDTINTSAAGATTVNSGTGDATINLNDTKAAVAYSGTFNDHVWLDDGHATVYANGTADAIVATTEGQTIYGGTLASAQLAVVLAPNSDATANGNDYVSAGAGTAVVYSDVSNDTIAAGSGTLYYLASSTASVSDTLVAGSGNVYGYTGAGDNVSVTGTGTGSFTFLVGGGAETIDGANSSATQVFYAQADTSSAGSQLLIGGSGTNYFIAGEGSETLTGGAGHNTFFLNDSLTAGSGTITINDFAGGSNNQLVLESGFTQNDVQTLLAGGTASASGYSVTLSDGVTINFTGITSGSELQGHIISQS